MAIALRVFILLAVFIPFVTPCNFNFIQANPTFTNLATSTPFTYVETVFAESCSPPYVWTEWRTAYVDGGTYSCPNVTVIAGGSTEVTYTFPDLILTTLHAGDVISMSNTFTPGFGVGTEVATTGGLIITVSVTSTSTSTSSTSSSTVSIVTIITTVQMSPTPTQTSSTTIGTGPTPSHHISGGAIGGIVAGAVTLLIVVIVALFSYRTRKSRRRKTISRDQMQSEPLGTAAFTSFGGDNFQHIGKPEEPLGAPQDSNGHVATRTSVSTDLLLSGTENSHQLAGINFGTEDQN